MFILCRNDLIPEAAATLGSDAASAAASSLLRATLAAIRLFPSAHEGSSSMRLPPSLQPSEPSHHRSPLHPSPHPPASLLPSRSAQQQQHEAEEPGTFIAFAWGPFNSGNSQTAGGRGQSQLGLAGGPQAAAAAAAGPQHSRRLSQAEIDERMASRRVGVSHSRANPQGHAGAGSTFGTSNRCYHRQ